MVLIKLTTNGHSKQEEPDCRVHGIRSHKGGATVQWFGTIRFEVIAHSWVRWVHSCSSILKPLREDVRENNRWLWKGQLSSRDWTTKVSEIQLNNKVNVQASKRCKESRAERRENKWGKTVNIFERCKVINWLNLGWWCRTVRALITLKTIHRRI